MKVKVIVAIAKNRGIGKDNNLLWHLPKDMAFFRQSTSGHYIVTGRKNYESIPERFRPLKNRTNVVVTRQKDYDAPGAVVVNSYHSAIELARDAGQETVYVIGGGQIYQEALNSGHVDEMLITHVDATFDADVFFPEFDTSQWSEEVLAHFDKDEKHEFEFEIIRYKKK